MSVNKIFQVAPWIMYFSFDSKPLIWYCCNIGSINSLGNHPSNTIENRYTCIGIIKG